MKRTYLVARVFQVLGIASLLFAVLLLMMMYYDHHSGAWFPNLLDDFIWNMVLVLVLLGLSGIIFAYWSKRSDRESDMGLRLGASLDKKRDDI